MLQGLKKDCMRLQSRTRSAGPWGEISERERGRFHDGTGLCGHYDVELDLFGFCRDEDCRRERLIKALHSGEAMRNAQGVIIWTPGTIIRKMEGR